MKKSLKFALSLLEFIKEVGELTSEIVFTPYGKLRLTPRSSYYYTLRRLEKEGMVKKQKKKNKTYCYFLTEKGRRVLKKPSQLKRRVDGHSTIILFDIPESKHKQRTIFRRYLIRNGYTLIQKSVLVSPYIFSEEIKDLIAELNIQEYVKVASVIIEY